VFIFDGLNDQLSLNCFKCYNSYWLNHDNSSADFVIVFVRLKKSSQLLSIVIHERKTSASNYYCGVEYGRRLPSWICLGSRGTTHEGPIVVAILRKKFVMISIAVLKN